VGAKGERPDRVAVALQNSQFAATGHVPELDCFIRASRRQRAPVGAENNGRNGPSVTRQSSQLAPPLDVPELDLYI